MREVIIAGNWKMNKTDSEAVEFINQLAEKTGNTDMTVIIAPSFVALKDASAAAQGTNIKIAAQNLACEDCGAYTGEISTLMIKDHCDYVIIGHSERRGFFHETNKEVNSKIKRALAHGIRPIMCIGESKLERDEGRTFDVIRNMLEEGLRDIDITKVIIAYEPVWAISRGDPNHKAATSEDAQDAHRFIRGWLKERIGDQSEKVQIIYGGSVKPENVTELMAQQDIDGGLVGGASLDVDSFASLINF
jgi:triosephosphate isomerase